MTTWTMIALAVLAIWLLVERAARIDALARLAKLEHLLHVGPTSGERDLTYLERQLLGLRPSWNHADIPLNILAEPLTNLALGMSHAQVEAEVARRSQKDPIATASDGRLSYFVERIQWLEIDWGMNLTIESGRLVEAFLFAPTKRVGLRNDVNDALQRTFGQPLEEQPSQFDRDPRYLLASTSPQLRDRKNWRIPLAGVWLRVCAMGDDLHAAVSLRVEA